MNGSLNWKFSAAVVTLISLVPFGSTYVCDTPEEWLTGGRNKSFFPGNKWPNAIVKYELHSSLSSNDRSEVQKAFNDIQSKTCIRFQQRSPGEQAYTSIEFDDNVCGLGHFCRTGGYQFAKFGGGCRNMNVMVHELGHNLCLGHEQTRRDRDDYLNFPGCSANDIPGKDNFETRGHLYDYVSQMHYQCGWCPGGWPKQSGVSHCGSDRRQGLSVLDADKLNDFYDCKGCLGHRWKPINSLSGEDVGNLLRFGEMQNGQPLYICRGYMGNEIAIGKFRADTRVCFLPYGGREHVLTSRAQVLTVPGNSRSGMESSYKAVPVNATRSLRASYVPAGRKGNGIEGYAAVAEINENGIREFAIGKVWADEMGKAYIPFGGRELQVTGFGVLAC